MDPGARALIKNGLVKIGASAVEPLVATLRQSESPALPSPVSPGRRLVPELIQALCSTRLLAQQAELIEALREAGAPAATALVGALRAEQDQGRQTILHVALGQMGQVAVPAIVAAIKGADWQFRLRAIDLLGDAGGSEGIESLTRLLGHPELVTRNAAADALARIGPAALEPLLAALKSPDGSVRGAACRGMRGAGKQAVDPLTAALKDKYWSVLGFNLALLPGCCAYLVSHHTFVEKESQNRGYAKRLQIVKADIAKAAGFSSMLCTVISDNAAEIHILETHGWQRTREIRNRRTGNIVYSYQKDLK